jgi:hypothetical protein
MTCADTMVNDIVHYGKRKLHDGWRNVYNTPGYVEQRNKDTEKLRTFIANNNPRSICGYK